MNNEEKLKNLSNYINEKIENALEYTLDPIIDIPKTNYYCGYIKALEDLKDFLDIWEDKWDEQEHFER